MEERDGSFTASTGDTGGWLQTYKIGGPRPSYSIMAGCSKELFLGSSVWFLAFLRARDVTDIEE